MNSREPETKKWSAHLSADSTGWATITAPPHWWRALADAPNLREILEQAATMADSRQDPTLCLAIGATTKRPCRFPRQECPHHGEDSDKHRCGVIGKNKHPCRWNTTTGGPCPNHDASTTAPQPRRHLRSVPKPTAPVTRGRPVTQSPKPIQVVCPHCQAQPGAKCRYPNGSETSFHRLRRKAALHAST